MKICSEEIGDQGDLVDAKSKHLCVKSLNSYFLPHSSRILKEAANMCLLRSNNDKKQRRALMRTKPCRERRGWGKEDLARIILSAPLHCPYWNNTMWKQPSCFIYNSTIPMIFARVLVFPFFVKNTSHMCFPLWWICSGIANSGNLWLSWKFTHGPVLPLPQLHFFFHSKHWNK